MSADSALIFDPMPEEVASWLRGNEWTRITRSEGRAALWARGANEVLQPTLREASDYELRYADMLRRLALWEHRPIETLAQEMIQEGSDVTEWRASGSGQRDFSVALEDGFHLVQAVRNAFVAVANATVQRRGYFGHSTLKVAREHARTIRMGQTRRGSYVIPIISRIPGAVEQPEDGQARFALDVSAQPFERRVMAQMAHSLATIEELAVRSDRRPTMRQLNESVGDGVSHELCMALAGVLKSSEFGDVNVAFSWARRLPRNPQVRQVSFPKQSADVIEDMGERLRGSDVIGEQAITGFVRSHRSGDQESFIYLRAPIGDKVRTVGMEVTSDQLHEALMAAAEKKPLFVRGRLIHEQGRAWRFESISELGVSEAAPLSWGSGRED